jgi:thioredoxin 1
MKIVGALLLVVACVHANSIHRYGWTPQTESVFRFESQVLKGIPAIRNTQYAGLKITAQVRVQAFQDYTLHVKIEHPRFVTLNGQISLTEANRILANGGPHSGAKDVNLGSFQRYLEEPILVHLKRGLIENFFVAHDEPVSVTNIKRSLLSQLQLDVTGSQPIAVDIPRMGAAQGLYHKVLEESVVGNCYTEYNILPMTPARVIELERAWEDEERSAQLTPSEQGKKVCEGKTYYEIIKTRDLDHCRYSPQFQHVSGADFSGDVTKSRVGNLETHMISSTTYACGELSDFTIRKIVVDDHIVNNPTLYNNEQKQTTRARIMMELLEKKRASNRMSLPSQTRRETSLVYGYEGQESWRQRMSSEVIHKTEQILGTDPLAQQDNLTDAPISLWPVQLPSNEIISKVVAHMKTIARAMNESPEIYSSRLDIAGQLSTVSKYMQTLSLNDLEQVWTQTLAGISQEHKMSTKQLLMDTLAMVGTNPSTVLVLKKIDAAEISFIKATATIQSAMKSIRTPTKELLSKLVNTVKKWKNDQNMEKKKLLTPTLLQLSNLLYHAYVNPSTMVSNYPVRIYGIFGTNSSEVLVNEYIPLLTQMLDSSVEPVLIAALGKLGHLEAVKPILEIAQDRNKAPMIRSLAIYSLKRVSKQNPTVMKPVLLALVNNPVEHADVRIAAISVLPWTQPSYAELQKIAVRSWYETSKQVSSFARSTFESLLYTEVPELKPLGMKVKGILHMFKPSHYGIQFSKNIHISDFVRYLFSTFSTEAAYTATKESVVPSRISYNKEVFMQVLGEGLKMNFQSFSVYSQAMERAIDTLLKVKEVFGDMLTTTQPIAEELRKIAQEIQLIPRVARESKAVVFYRNMGYEYGLELTADTFFTMLESISQGNVVAKLNEGIETNIIAAANLFSMSVYRPTEAGIYMIARHDLPSVLAAKASLKYADAQGVKVTASFVPLWNIKMQSYSSVISPFNKEIVASGVSSAVHIAAPLEGEVTARKGELDIVFRFPRETLHRTISVEAISAFVMPFTLRRTIGALDQAPELKEIVSGEPLKRYSKQSNGLVYGEFKFESDNKFIDFYSYWEKIRQTNIAAYPEVIPFLSSVRKSSVTVILDPIKCEMKEVSLKLRLWAQKPSTLMAIVSKPIESSVIQEIQPLPSVRKAFSLLHNAPASLLKAEVAIKRFDAVEKAEAYVILGYNPDQAPLVKSVAAATIKVPQAGIDYGVLYNGVLRLPNINARWSTHQLVNQPLVATYDAEILYGDETRQQNKEKIRLQSELNRSLNQRQSVRESEEFRKCGLDATAGRRLSPICIKVRNQAGSIDTAEIYLEFPQRIYKSAVLSTLEELVKANFMPYYKQQAVPQLPAGLVHLKLNFARAGDVANVKVVHKNDAYILKAIRIPMQIQGVMPLCVRNTLFDWIEQKSTHNYAPASCRIEPEFVSTFDNKTYAYKINDCEHVLMLDGSRVMPVAVVTKTVSGQEKMVKILSGITKVELVPDSGYLKVKLNGREITINPRETYVKKDAQTGMAIVEIKHYQDGVYHVYLPSQLLHVLTDGKSIEVVAPQLLKNRAAGLCGDLNGEKVADLPSPQKCIMKPEFAAYSYMLNKESSSQPRCAGIPRQHLSEYRREIQECVKDEIIPTPLVPLFERATGGLGMGGYASNGVGYGESQGGSGQGGRSAIMGGSPMGNGNGGSFSGSSGTTMVQPCYSPAELNKALQDAGNKLVVIDFCANWSIQCKMMGAEFWRLSVNRDFSDVLFLKVDIDQDEESAEEYNISPQSIPTFIFVKNNERVGRYTGTDTLKLMRMIKQRK